MNVNSGFNPVPNRQINSNGLEKKTQKNNKNSHVYDSSFSVDHFVSSVLTTAQHSVLNERHQLEIERNVNFSWKKSNDYLFHKVKEKKVNILFCTGFVSIITSLVLFNILLDGEDWFFCSLKNSTPKSKCDHFKNQTLTNDSIFLPAYPGSSMFITQAVFCVTLVIMGLISCTAGLIFESHSQNNNSFELVGSEDFLNQNLLQSKTRDKRNRSESETQQI